jgi:hypothetical protein
MEHYIKKSALVSEIEKRRSKNAKNKLNLAASFEDDYLLSFLDTLEVKGVDLNEYYHEFLQKEWFGNSHVRTVSEMMAFTAKHFFELGIKAQKGE